MSKSDISDIAQALHDVFVSPNVTDSNFEPAGLTDVIHHLAKSTTEVAEAITPKNALMGEDEAGGKVGSLTEAVMGMTSGLIAISRSIDNLADKVNTDED